MAERQVSGYHTPQSWDEAVMPTPAELADWLGACTEADRLAFASRALHAAGQASRCFMRGHDMLEGEVSYLRERANRYRCAWVSARRWRTALRLYSTGVTP